MTETRDITTGIIDVGDARLRYWERGTGPAVLLLHAGVFGDWFAPVFDEPALDGVRLIRVHRAGYGESSVPDGPLTLADHGRHGRDLLRGLGVERAYWVGHSSGASIAVQAALDGPDAIDGLVLFEPAPSPRGPSSDELMRTAVGPAVGAAQAGDVAGAADVFLRGVVGPGWAETVRRTLGDGAVERVVSDARYFFADEAAAAGQWPMDETIAARIGTRTLLAYGEAGVTPAHEETARALAGMLPDAELVGMPGVGHGMPLEDPSGVARLIADTVGGWEHGR